MNKGEYKLALQHGKYGYFGEVILETELVSQNGLQIIFDEQNVFEWQAGIQFGIEYLWERLPRHNLKLEGLVVRVLKSKGHIVDTTHLVMAYVTIHALIKALGLDEFYCGVCFDKATGVFCFPK